MAVLTGWDTPAGLGVTGNQTLFFSNPAASYARMNLTLKASVDGGCRWSEVLRVNTGTSMYSSVVQFADGAFQSLLEHFLTHFPLDPEHVLEGRLYFEMQAISVWHTMTAVILSVRRKRRMGAATTTRRSSSSG
jgi:hypothetical protein